MRRTGFLLTSAAVLALSFAPSLAFARAGGGGSFGSRGSMTYSAPPMTRTAPYAAAPMERSMTPQSAPSYASPGGYGAAAPAFGARSGFMSGIMGGLIGAGIGGMLFGHGMFGGFSGMGSVFGLLIQLLLVFFLVRWLYRMFASRQPAMAGGPGLFNRNAAGPMPTGGGGGGAPRPAQVTVTPGDFQAFEQLLKAVQAAWSAHDLATLQRISSPEMVSYFSEQLSDQASRGVRNSVTAVNLDQGDLSQAWVENGREYATVAMRFSMIDVTVDGANRIVDGSPNERVSATEIWTFVRAARGAWLLSAIQQTR